MGCNIHAIIAEKTDSNKGVEYQRKAALEIDRDYLLFALMAGVRNRWDFEPVAEPRGECPEFVNIWDDYLGDHSFSWLTLSELEEVNRRYPIEAEKNEIGMGENRDLNAIAAFMREMPDSILIFGFDG